MKKRRPGRPGAPPGVKGALAALLVASVLAQLAVEGEPPFAAAGWLGVPALFGFAAAVATILLARLFGALFGRPDDHYDGDGDG